jgi:hypothetical protein
MLREGVPRVRALHPAALRSGRVGLRHALRFCFTSALRSSAEGDPVKQPTTSEGAPIHMSEPLTLAHPHAMVAKTGYWAGFVVWPGGHTTPGRTRVKR